MPGINRASTKEASKVVKIAGYPLVRMRERSMGAKLRSSALGGCSKDDRSLEVKETLVQERVEVKPAPLRVVAQFEI